MRRRFSASLVLLAAIFSGCQCWQCTEDIADVVDAVGDHGCCADDLYCPGLDLTRIGRRDWCQYPINNWWCPCRCSQQCPESCPQE